jgi:MbtH protein
VAPKEDTRKACLDFIEENWTDMRPKSLIEQMKQDEEQAKRNGNGRKKTTAKKAAK